MHSSPIAVPKFAKVVRKQKPDCPDELRRVAAYAQSMRELTIAMREAKSLSPESEAFEANSEKLEQARNVCSWNLAALAAKASPSDLA